MFHLEGEEVSLELVPKRLRGELASFDILDDEGKVIAEEGRRITSRHISQLEKAGINKLVVPDEYIIGNIAARPIVHPVTGEIIAECNSDITAELLEECRKAGVVQIGRASCRERGEGWVVGEGWKKKKE